VKRVVPPDDALPAAKGTMSNFLHDRMQVGDLVDLLSPQGTFCVDPQVPRNLALVAGGVGITPMIRILNALREQGWERSIYLFYVVRDATEYPFREHLRELARRWPTLRLFVFCTQPAPELHVGVDYRRQGRIQASHLMRVASELDLEYYLCGPTSMMSDLTSGLVGLGVSRERIHTEAFGPPARTPQLALAGAAHGGPRAGGGDLQPEGSSTGASTVRFAHSGKSAAWSDAYGSLLELAEQVVFPVESGSRAGNCGTCALAVKAGRVTHPPEIETRVEPGMCLACLAVSDGDVEIDV